ncbi:hypothetical protein A2960_04050 [Candidatus Gottesmanbacteria bacterium RIFCSPLOWO2_01_FULL_39_12b]|uniref:Glycosyltransferase RgtA/B/C/D-like domain-containing protein n=1 Tax=Candidatus Gottesmanbacteria bacterium RIFCSPLOWO2_01_FULL_39_12b TaxID=1798388 RepID=A0A1F6AN66_9BACT|nr:MAG: hypothetical protein A2960_04050 [Candidatus Gottesmanbacteria bacterium RIFCSPLOWO2_01_FULL_39_12b]
MRYVIVFLFILGFLFRLWFIKLVPQFFVFDQVQYHDYAQRILQYPFFSDSIRPYGYSMMIALIYRVFGTGEIYWKVIQALFDTGTAFLVFLIAKKLMTYGPAYIAYILYLFNPYTSAYVGVLLTEVLAIFLTTLVFYLLLRYLEKRSLLLISVLGLLLAYLVEVKPIFMAFTVTILVLMIFLIRRMAKTWRIQILNAGLLILFYFLPFSYNIIGNLKYWGQPALLNVDSAFLQNFYVSMFIERSYPVTSNKWKPHAVEVNKAFEDFAPNYDRKQAGLRDQKYYGLIIKKIREDPVKIIRVSAAKMWYIWEKNYLFPYDIGPTNSRVDFLVYWSNIGILISAIIGFALWMKSQRRGHKKYILFGSMILFFIIYLTVFHAVSSGEERYTLPAYSLIFIFTGFSIWILIKKLPYRILLKFLNG